MTANDISCNGKRASLVYPVRLLAMTSRFEHRQLDEGRQFLKHLAFFISTMEFVFNVDYDSALRSGNDNNATHGRNNSPVSVRVVRNCSSLQ